MEMSGNQKKGYGMGQELKTIGAVVSAKPTPRTTRYEKYDKPVGKPQPVIGGYNKYNPSVLPEKDQARVDLYHKTKGKIR